MLERNKLRLGKKILLSASDTMSQIMEGNLFIEFPDERTYQAVLHRWDKVAKPLDSLGKFEPLFARIGAIQGNEDPRLEPCELLVFCADNGIVEEGISQSDQSVTAQCAQSIGQGKSCTGIMAAQAGVRIRSIDIGIANPVKANRISPSEAAPAVENYKIRSGTRNFLKEPAMTQTEMRKALETGMDLVRDARQRGVRLLAAGEMGIGNTTTSACMAAALLGLRGEETAGRGAGLDDQRLRRKIQVINKALEKYHFGKAECLKLGSDSEKDMESGYRLELEAAMETGMALKTWNVSEAYNASEHGPETNSELQRVLGFGCTSRGAWRRQKAPGKEKPKTQEASNETELRTLDSALEKASKRREALRILQCVGGLDIAAMTGVYLGGAVYHVPIVLDGVISLVAALTAERILPGTKRFLIPSHVSREPAADRILRELDFHPVLDADMALGEGSGAVMMIDLLKMVERVYRESNDFSKIGVEAYERFYS